MPALLVFAIIIAAIAAALILYGRSLRAEADKSTEAAAGLRDRGDDYDTRQSYASHVQRSVVMSKQARVIRLSGIGAGAVAAILFVVCCVTVVPTKQIGVVTSFGSPQGTLDNGIHPKLPWEKVTLLDGAIQTDTDPYEVRLGNQSVATVDATIRWRLQPEAADDLYKDYHDFDNIRTSLVDKQLYSVLNQVYATYDPLAQLDNVSKDDQSGDPNIKFGEQAQQLLDDHFGEQIEVIEVLTPKPAFDQTTEEKISQYQQAKADTRIAVQKKATATAEAAANRILSDSVSHDPNVLVSKCLDIVKGGGVELPAGFTCWENGGQGIVLPAGR